MTYPTQKKLFDGYGGALYDSKAEAEASNILASHGIFRDTSGPLPVHFTDADGRQFVAKADFVHPPTGVRFEFKDSFLNGIKTKTSAESQHRASRSTVKAYRDLKFSWSNSATKLALVQEGIAAAGGALVALFWHKPDEATISRLNKRGVFWAIYDSPCWRSLLAFLKLRANGIPASLHYGESHYFQ